MFSGSLFPEHPIDYPSVWVGERSDLGWVTLPFQKGWNSHPPSLETKNIVIT